MGSPQNQKQQKTKKKQTAKKEEMSKSRKVVEYLNRFLDIIMWIIIAMFVYVWWIERGQPIDCSRITVDLCNHCYGQMKEILPPALNVTIP